MSGKRYYWLKLKDDFFHSKRIKRMRRMKPYGADYVIIYLKMQLVAMKKDGCIKFDGIDGDTFAEDIADDIDEDAGRVSEALEYMIARKLAIMQDGGKTLFLPWAVENVGMETAAAKRMRDMRQRKTDDPDGVCNNVTPMRNNVQNPLQTCYGEKRREEKRRIGRYTTDDSHGKLSPVSDGPQGEECFVDVNES